MAAVELARRGIVARVIDRNEGPTPLSKAVGINARSLDLLEPSGATARLLAAGLRVEEVRAHHAGRELATLRPALVRHRFNFLLALPQSETETILVDVLGELGGVVERRTTLTALRRIGDKVEVEIEGPDGVEDATFDLVFGADGVRSTVRHSLELAFDGHTHVRTWSIADVEIDGWPYAAGAAHLFLQQRGDVGFIVPIGTRRFRAVSNTEDALGRIPGAYTVSRVLREDRFQIPVRQVAHYQVGPVFLGGDAAHVHSPVGGRGMNLGIEDAATFARLCAEDNLAAYTGLRHPVGAQWIEASERVLSAVQTKQPLLVGLRSSALWSLGHLPWLQRALLERTFGLRQ